MEIEIECRLCEAPPRRQGGGVTASEKVTSDTKCRLSILSLGFLRGYKISGVGLVMRV